MQSDDMTSEMVESRLRHMKALCLERDGYRCVLTGSCTKEAVDYLLTVPDEDIRENTLTAHITNMMPFALRSSSNDKEVSIYLLAFQLSNAIFQTNKKVQYLDHTVRASPKFEECNQARAEAGQCRL